MVYCIGVVRVHMTVQVVKHSYYKIEIDTVDAPQHPIIYFRVGKCTTAKGMDRQHNRIVNETVEAWRPFAADPSLHCITCAIGRCSQRGHQDT